MAQKIPPPPQLTGPEWQIVNRWLLEVTAILNASGNIDPNSVAGLPQVITQSAANAAAIATLQGTTGGQGAAIATLQGLVASNTNSIATINGQITTLSSRNQVLNGTGVPGGGLGNNGDLYLNNTGAAGSWLYGKIAAAWVAIA